MCTSGCVPWWYTQGIWEVYPGGIYFSSQRGLFWPSFPVSLLGQKGSLRAGGGLPTHHARYFPPCQVASQSRIYASLLNLVEHSVDRCARYVHRSLVGVTLLLGTSTRVGIPLRKEAFLTLRIIPPEPGNSPDMTKKPVTESPVAQGRQESPNPSRSALRPPSRLEPAFSFRP